MSAPDWIQRLRATLAHAAPISLSPPLRSLVKWGALLSLLVLTGVYLTDFEPTQPPLTDGSFEINLDAWKQSDLIQLDAQTPLREFGLRTEFLDAPILVRALHESPKAEGVSSFLFFKFFRPNDVLHAILAFPLYGNGAPPLQGYGVPVLVHPMTPARLQQAPRALRIESVTKAYAEAALQEGLTPLAKEDLFRVTVNFQIVAPPQSRLRVFHLGWMPHIQYAPALILARRNMQEEFVRQQNALATSFHAPSQGNSFLELTSGTDTVEIQHSISVQKERRYLLLVDARILVGNRPPILRVRSEREWKTLLTATAPVAMAQTGWTRMGGILETGPHDRVTLALTASPFLAPDGQITSGIFRYDNLQLLPLPDQLTPEALERRILQAGGRSAQGQVQPHALSGAETALPWLEEKLPQAVEKTGLPVYDLRLDEDGFWSQLSPKDGLPDYNPNSRNKAYPASLEINGTRYPVKVHLRGTNGWHYDSPVKSWRIRFEATPPRGLNKELNLLRMETRGIVGEHLFYNLARRMGLVALDNRFVFLRLNGRSYGVMFELENWGEDLLEKNGQPAGNVYGESNAFINVSWLNSPPEGKQKMVVNPYQPKANKEDITLMTALAKRGLRAPLYALLDLDALMTWNAHGVLTGSNHQSSGNNNRWYFNSASGRFSQIPWDNAWRLSSSLKDPFFYKTGANEDNDLSRFLLADPLLFDQRNRILWEYLSKEENEAEELRAFEEIYARLRPTLAELTYYELHLSNRLESFPALDALLKSYPEKLAAHRNTLRQLYERSSRGIAVQYAPTEDPSVLRLDLLRLDNEEFSSSRLERIGFPEALASRIVAVHRDDGDGIFQAKRDLPVVLKPASDTVELTLNPPVTLPSLNHLLTFQEGWSFSPRISAQERLTLFLTLAPDTEASLLAEAVQVQASNATTGAPLPVGTPTQAASLPCTGVRPHASPENRLVSELTATLAPTLFQNFPDLFMSRRDFLFLHPFFVPDPADPLRLVLPAGEHIIEHTVVVPPALSVTIEAGARLLFAPGASLISYGPLHATGSPDHPILFSALHPEQGWGNVAVIGPAAHGTFTNTLFEHGNGNTINGVYYSSMVSAHGADLELSQVIVRHANRHAGDDAVNVKYARGLILNSLFINNHHDAIDFDFPKPGSRIEGSRFKATGGDALDLSGSKEPLPIREIVIDGSGDKGISAGEGARVEVDQAVIRNAAVGVAAKDDAQVVMRHATLLDNQTGAEAYNKKPIYDGGHLSLSGVEFRGNRMDFGVERAPRSASAAEFSPSTIQRYQTRALATHSTYPILIREAKNPIKDKNDFLKAALKGTLSKRIPHLAVLTDAADDWQDGEADGAIGARPALLDELERQPWTLTGLQSHTKGDAP